MKSSLILFLLLFFSALNLSALQCIVMDGTSDPDSDGFYRAGAAGMTTVDVPNEVYCPPSYLLTRVISKYNIEHRECQEFSYQTFKNGLLVDAGFKHDRIRTSDQNNLDAQNWMGDSHPGKADLLNTFDDDCDGMVNEFEFSYYPKTSGQRQTGERQFKVNLKINEPDILGTNLYNIQFDVYKLEQLISIDDPTIDPDDYTTPITTHTVNYTGNSTLNTTITVPDNIDQIYVVTAKLMTRPTPFFPYSYHIVGIDSTTGNLTTDESSVNSNDMLYSEYYFTSLSRYENGEPTSLIRSDIVNDAFYYKYLADIGFITRQNNYAAANGTGFDTIPNGVYFGSGSLDPWEENKEWCSEFVAYSYWVVDDSILVGSQASHEGTNYLEIGVQTMRDWFHSVQTNKNGLSSKDNLLHTSQVNANGSFVSSPMISSDLFFQIEKIEMGDYVITNNFKHSAMYLGESADGDYFTIEGNYEETIQLLKRDYDDEHYHSGRIKFIGTLPY